MSRFFQSLRRQWRDPQVREFLTWCLPALVIGLVLRVALTVQMPYAFYHDDASDFFDTPDKLFSEGELKLHAKKTWLVPTLFTVPFLVRIPAMIAIPLLQHVLGLGLVVLVGLLCRLWFWRWRWFVLPLTLLTAINPFCLWFEHTVMAETVFVFCTALVALAGTLYARQRSWERFAFLGGALFLVAGARPEGKLLFGFGMLLLVLLHGRRWRVEWPRIAILLALGIATHFLTRTSQAGLLLYTSVVRLTPSQLKAAPGFDPYIAPLRSDLQQRWAQRPSYPRVRDRRAVADAVERYLKDHPHLSGGKPVRHGDVNEFCLKLASETCLKNAAYLPVLAYHKFRAVATEAPSGLLDNAWLFEKQREAYTGSSERVLRLSRGLFGRAMRDEAELQRFIDTRYGEVRWFNDLTATWLRAVNALRLPDARYEVDRDVYIYPGVPIYFLLALLGVIAAALRRGVLQPVHLAWGVTLLGFFFVIMVTANVRPRFRFVFEPFWFIYLALLFDAMLPRREMLPLPAAEIIPRAAEMPS